MSRLSDEVERIAYYVQVLSLQGDTEEAAKYLVWLQEQAKSIQLPVESFFTCQHSVALYWMACDNFDAAQQAWEASLVREHELPEPLRYIRCDLNRRWLATCLYKKGDRTRSRRLFQDALQDAREQGRDLSVMFCQTRLTAIELDEGHQDRALECLAESRKLAYQCRDRSGIAEIRQTYARLHTLCGNFSAARDALAEAIDIFERLGKRRELAEAREAMSRLDKHAAATS